MAGIIEDYKQLYEKFENEFEKIKQAYEDTKDEKLARADLQKLASEYRSHYGACLVFLEYGKEIFDRGEIEYGFKILQIGMNTFKEVPRDTGIYLRFVQYNMEHNQEGKAEEYLLKICNEISNYDESIEWSGMSTIWEKYKYLVDGKVPLPLSQRQPVAKTPDKCTKQIGDILQLPKDELLNELSEHLGEMSCYGEEITYLNKWEKIIFDADNLLTGVGADGVDSWLLSYGHRMEQTKKALLAIEAKKAFRFLEEIEKRFPRGKVPKSCERIEAILDKMLDNDEDFEEEESRYYYDADVEAELIEGMYQFVVENKKRFR